MYNPIELPSLDEIAEMEQARTKAIESLEMSSDGSLVKCQKCGSLYPVIKKEDALTSSNYSGRITRLQAMIRRSEKYTRLGSCKKELADLLKEEEKMNILRRLPLYSSKISQYKWYCSKCYDEIYLESTTGKKQKI
jgi:hypothetical protein